MAPGGTAAGAPTGVSDEALDGLFHGPLEEFTPARNALAKELRGEGDGDAAAWVKQLKKPTRPAWLVNQLGVRKRDAVDELLALGERLRDLQQQMLAGSVDRDRLREAAQGEQRAIEELIRTAEAIGREHSVGAQVLDRVAETLQAASSDPEVAEAIAKGRLQREARATSLGLVGPATEAPKRGRGSKRGEASGDEAAAERRARQQAERRRRAAERKLAAAEKRLARARTAAEVARESLSEREVRVQEAEAELAEARLELEQSE